MKKILILFSCCALLAACGGNESEYESYYDKDQSEAAEATDVAAPVDQTKVGADASVNEMIDSPMVAGTGEAVAINYSQGAKLIAMSDCLSCHQENQQLVGPSYKAVAERYAFNTKNVNYLAQKIMEGGAGVWGQVPMTPHPDLEPEQAQEMAKYILSLHKE